MANPAVIRRYADATSLDRELIYYPFVRRERISDSSNIIWTYGQPSFQWGKRLTNYSELDQLVSDVDVSDITEDTSEFRNYLLRYKNDLISFDMYQENQQGDYFQVIGIEELSRQQYHVVYVRNMFFDGRRNRLVIQDGDTELRRRKVSTCAPSN